MTMQRISDPSGTRTWHVATVTLR